MHLQASSLAALSGIRHAFFTREGGVSEGIYTSLNGGLGSQDDPARVAENRARMAAALDVAPSHLVTAYQIHSPDVIVAEEPWTHASRPRVDAIVTRTPGLAIGVSTADCGPVLFADAKARVIGATGLASSSLMASIPLTSESRTRPPGWRAPETPSKLSRGNGLAGNRQPGRARTRKR